MRPLVTLALPLTVVLTGCSWFQRPPEGPARSAEKTPCAVNVYFVTHATHAQEMLVGAKLRRDPRVEKVVFVSKAQALAELQRRTGKLPKTFTNPNPLPASFTITPAQRSETGQLEASIARSHWPGVATVRLKLCKR